MIYEVVRKADVPKSARLAATCGAILVRGGALLGEQLKSDDDAMFAVAIGASRLLPDRDVTQLLLGTLGTVPPARQVLVIGALEGRRDPTVLPAVQKAAAGGPVDVRLAAIRALGELADPSSVPVLLAAFSGPEPALAETAQASLAKLAGPGVDAAIAAKLERANPKTRIALLDVVARRRIVAAMAATLKAADDPQPEVRLAAIRALGRIIGQQEFPALVARLLAAKNPDEIKLLQEALQAACPRISDRDACAERLAGLLGGSNVVTRSTVIEWIGRVGGTKALGIVSADARSASTEIQDAAMRTLGNWPNVEAAPVLLDLAKNLASDKLKSRALRGYIRLARQMDLPPDRRLAMCEEALRTARRDDEKKLALAVLVRIPSSKTLALAASYLNQATLKEEAAKTAVAIAEKLVRSEPGTVAAAMQQVLQAGAAGRPAAQARSLLEQATPKGRVAVRRPHLRRLGGRYRQDVPHRRRGDRGRHAQGTGAPQRLPLHDEVLLELRPSRGVQAGRQRQRRHPVPLAACAQSLRGLGLPGRHGHGTRRRLLGIAVRRIAAEPGPGRRPTRRCCARW